MAASRSILLMGLDRPARELALGLFSGLGHQVAALASISEASSKLSQFRPDLIFLQASSDDLGVAELQQILKDQPNLPVVLLCTQSSIPSILDAWHAGAADVVLRPVTEQSLLNSLTRVEKLISGGDGSAGNEPIARLHFLNDLGLERWATIVPPRFTIGRSSNNDLPLNNNSISRQHAEIRFQGRDYLVQDIGSKHGTFVNGIRVEQPTKLRTGDRIQLGGPTGFTLTFHHGDLLQSLLRHSDYPLDMGISIRGFREIGMLLATFHALSSISLLDDLLSLVVDTAIELTGVERGFIMLKDESGNLTFRCARDNCKSPLAASSFQTSHRVPDEVFRTGKRVVINDLDLGDESEDHSWTRRLGVRTIFCVPLNYVAFHDSTTLSGMSHMESLGVLYVDSQSTGARLSKSQIEALETLASEAAMAIYNAKLYKESQEKRRLDEELRIAHEIQQALLPAPNKVLPFANACSQNLPCHEVGGDYFDYFDAAPDRLGFALGDVAGKGMPAALFASVLQGIFSAETLLDRPLPAMISNANRHLVKHGTGSSFITFFFGVLDADGNCTYINAGHNPPILVRRDGSMSELREGGTVLGLIAAADYQSGCARMEPGDHLVLFSDGVLEARDTSGEEFGEDRLRALLSEHSRRSAPEILAQVSEAVLSFSASTPQHDDITAMVIGYRE
jgi:phosphoserine phosphatase RsbU/P